MRIMRSTSLLRLVPLLRTLIVVSAIGKDLSKYLYLPLEPEKRGPVLEFFNENDTPLPFLNDPHYPHPRVVEFYAHWCPHCQHFRPRYSEFAKKMTEFSTLVEVFAVSCVPYDKVCKQNGVHGFPTVKLFPANSINGTKFETNQLHPLAVLRQFGISSSDFMPGGSEKVDETKSIFVNNKHDNINSNISHENGQRYFMSRSKTQIFHDAHLSFDFGMRTAVFLTNDKLDEKRKSGLREFLQIVQKTFPTTASIHPVVEALLEEFEEISKSEAALISTMDRFPPPSSKWSPACMQHGTGYTCGLWQMFHIITVGTVEWNRASPNSSYQLEPAKVAEAIRLFVELFFQCEECRMHFMHEYDSCSYDRCNRLVDKKSRDFGVKEWRELPLWLYETHNGVNIRLRKERIARNDEEPETTTQYQVMWPPREKCSYCWLSEGRWDEDVLYHYLISQYWDEGMRNEKSNLLPESRSEPKNHLIQDLGGKLTEKATFDDGPEDDEYILSWKPIAVITAALAVLSLFGLWYRKLQYDRKGIHKRRDSL